MATRTLVGQLTELSAQVRLVDVLSHERSAPEQVKALATRILDLIAKADALGDDLLQMHAWVSEPKEPGPKSLHALNDDTPGLARAADLAFVMRMDLMPKRQRILESLERGDIELLTLCETSRTGLLDALQALSSCIASEAEPPVLDSLQRALAIRRTCGKFRAQVSDLPNVEATSASLQRGLRAAGTLIAMLIGSDAYPYFRISDRYQVSRLQRRILSFLESLEPTNAGVDLFRDFQSFVGILSLVNRRQELRLHDQAQLKTWLNELDGESDVDVPLLVPRYRSVLYGLDAELDCLLDGRAVASRPALLLVLDKLVDSPILADDFPTTPENPRVEFLDPVPVSHP